jgi:peptide/nickel transport system substrate-binding protein
MRLGWLLALALIASCYERGGSSQPPPRSQESGPARAVETTPPAPGRPDPDGVVRIALEAEPATLDPFVAADGVTARLLRDVYEGLLCPGEAPAAPPVPCLATAVRISDDGRTWRFALRPGVRFHDGTAVTAGDAAFAFERLRGAERSYLAAELDDLASVAVAAGELVLVFRAARPDRAGAIARVPILPRALAEREAAPLARAPVGTGPLRVTAWRPGESIELARWPGAWRGPSASAKVVHVVVADRADALRRLARAELDVVMQVPIDEAVRFSDEHRGVSRFGYLQPAYVAAVLNARRPALATVESRRGLASLLDGATVRRTILGGAPAITGPFPPGDAGIDPAVAAIRFDRALAAKLLPRPPRVRLLVPQGSRAMARIADVWASDARGVADIAVEEVPFADLIARLREGRFDAALTSMTTGPELDLWPRLHSRAPRDEAWSGLRDAELDRLLDAVRAEPDLDRRADLRRALHRRIAALVPMVFIAADARVGLAAGDVGGLGDGRGGPPAASALWRARR